MSFLELSKAMHSFDKQKCPVHRLRPWWRDTSTTTYYSEVSADDTIGRVRESETAEQNVMLDPGVSCVVCNREMGARAFDTQRSCDGDLRIAK